MIKKNLGKCLLWGSLIGISTGVATILDIKVFNFEIFDIRHGGFPFYSIKVLPMIVVLILMRHKNANQLLISGLFLTLFISLTSEITLIGYFQLIEKTNYEINPWIFVDNIKILSISSAVTTLVINSFGKFYYQADNNERVNHESEVIDSESI